VSGVIELWADTCDTLIVYEHEADEQVKTTHCHLLMTGSKYKTAEPLKRLFYKTYPQYKSSDGNGLWSWCNKDYPCPDFGFIDYMSKGVLEPKFVSGHDVEDIAAAKARQAEKNTQYQQQQQEQQEQKTRQTSLHEHTKSEKLTKHAIIAKVVNLIQSQNSSASLDDLNEEYVLRVIRKVLIQERQVIGLYKVIDLYDGYLMYHDKGKFLTNCLMLLEKRKPRI
jgi:hypothetical protein